MSMKAGTISSFSSSMAAAIEHAFNTEWNKQKPEQPLDQDTINERRLIFVAVAQGVLKFLAANIDSLKVEVDVQVDQYTHQGDGTSSEVSLQLDGEIY